MLRYFIFEPSFKLREFRIVLWSLEFMIQINLEHDTITISIVLVLYLSFLFRGTKIVTLQVIFSQFFVAAVGFAFLLNSQNHLKQLIILKSGTIVRNLGRCHVSFNVFKASSKIDENIKKTSSSSPSPKPSLQF